MNASPESDLAPAEPQRGRAALNPDGSAINTGWPAAAISPDNQTLAPLNRHR
jgi:hypothetical protein